MPERMSGQAAGAMLVAVSLSVTTFTALLPALSDVRKGSKNDLNIREDVRTGEIAASALVIGIGIIASGVAGSPAPAMASVVAAGALVVMYETVLAK